jgi:hypothetical protein
MPGNVRVMSAAVPLLEHWLARAVSSEGMSWLRAQCAAISGGDQRAFFLSFGSTSRRVGKDDLKLGDADLAQAQKIAPGWNPRQWSCDQAARARLALALPSADPEVYIKILDQVFAAADVGELVALYQSLPLLAHQTKLAGRAAEGIRNNIKAVFDAVALDNPYPSAHLDDNAWNQMIVKALFVGSPLGRIVGLDRRANAKLTRMLCSYAHERWAAKRTVNPELWRPVSMALDDEALPEVNRALQDDREAVVAQISESPDPRIRAVIAGEPR